MNAIDNYIQNIINQRYLSEQDIHDFQIYEMCSYSNLSIEIIYYFNELLINPNADMNNNLVEAIYNADISQMNYDLGYGIIGLITGISYDLPDNKIRELLIHLIQQGARINDTNIIEVLNYDYNIHYNE